MAFPLQLTALFCCIFSILHLSVTASPYCNIGIYGVPDYGDCMQAFSQIPYAQERPSQYDSNSFQLYAEPQYMVPPFCSVYNRYRPRPINQLPKIWRYGMSSTFSLAHALWHWLITSVLKDSCRVAFMSYGRNSGRTSNALFSTNWRSILDQFQPLFTCLNPQMGSRASGGYTPFICR